MNHKKDHPAKWFNSAAKLGCLLAMFGIGITFGVIDNPETPRARLVIGAESFGSPERTIAAEYTSTPINNGGAQFTPPGAPQRSRGCDLEVVVNLISGDPITLLPDDQISPQELNSTIVLHLLDNGYTPNIRVHTLVGTVLLQEDDIRSVANGRLEVTAVITPGRWAFESLLERPDQVPLIGGFMFPHNAAFPPEGLAPWAQLPLPDATLPAHALDGA